MKLRIILVAIALSILTGCSKQEIEPKSTESLLIYIAANNNLSSISIKNYEDMLKGFIPDHRDNSKILMVMMRNKSEEPTLKRVFKDETGEIYSTPIATFDDKFSAVDTRYFRAVLQSAEKAYPAQKRGLILWSHGTGWLPPNTRSTKSFGEDNHNEMDIKDMVASIPHKYDYILFDACFMGSIEVAYQMRDKCSYLISSPAEIYANGFPYDKIIEPLLNDPLGNNCAGLKMVCQQYMDLYKTSSGTISLVKCNELDNLAECVREINTKYKSERLMVSKDYIQRYYVNNYKYFYDLDNYISKYATDLYPQFKSALDRCILYEGHSDILLNSVQLKNCCGLSTYIWQDSALNEYYKTLDWSIKTEPDSFEF